MKKFPCEESALVKSRKENKLLQESLWEESRKNEALRKENDRLKKENEKLKKELKELFKPPLWAKPNKSKEAKLDGISPGYMRLFYTHKL